MNLVQFQTSLKFLRENLQKMVKKTFGFGLLDFLSVTLYWITFIRFKFSSKFNMFYHPNSLKISSFHKRQRPVILLTKTFIFIFILYQSVFNQPVWTSSYAFPQSWWWSFVIPLMINIAFSYSLTSIFMSNIWKRSKNILINFWSTLLIKVEW